MGAAVAAHGKHAVDSTAIHGENAELVATSLDTVADPGDTPELRHHKSPDGVVVLVRKLDAEGVFDVGDEGEAAEEEVARSEWADELGTGLAAESPDEPVEEFVGGEDASGATVFINEDEELHTIAPHLRDCDVDADGARDDDRWPDRREPSRLAASEDGEEPLGVEHADDVVEVAFVHRVPSVLVSFDGSEHLVECGSDIDGDDLGPGHHRLVCADLAEFERPPSEKEL